MNLNQQICALKFEKKSFFNTISGFSLFWDHKSYDNENFRENSRNLTLIYKIHLKSDCIDGSVLNGVRQPILHSFTLDKPPGYNVFCEPETSHYKKLNRAVFDTLTLYLENDNHDE